MEIVLAALALVFDLHTGQALEPARFAQELARYDVVVFGEEHDATAFHDLRNRVVRELVQHRKDAVFSMEMLERDVQGVVDDYVRGRIDAATFAGHARPWTDHDRHYAPMLDIARERGLDVLAANAPAPLVRKVGRGGWAEVMGTRYAARDFEALRDRYYENFAETMQSTPGHAFEGVMLQRFYEAQVARDEAMAESIVDYLEARPYRSPLVVHLCGKFHSDHGLGTVHRLLRRRPLLRVAVITCVSTDNVREWKPDPALKNTAHYAVVVKERNDEEAPPVEEVPEAEEVMEEEVVEEEVMEEEIVEEEVVQDPVLEPAEAAPAKPAAPAAPAPTKKAEDKPASKPAPATTPSGRPATSSPSGRPATSTPTGRPAPSTPGTAGRPALGIMPDYNAEVKGLKISQVIPEGAAEKGGLLDGDVITKIGKDLLFDINDYMDVMAKLRPGQKVKVTVKRGDAEKTFDVTLGSR